MLGFEYVLKKSKGRYVRVVIKPGGVVEVFKPRFTPMFLVNKFLKEKEGWVLEKVKKLSVVQGKGKVQQRKEYLEKKKESRILVLEKLEYWKNFYQENFQIELNWKKVAIKNSKTRWGSCSSRKNLNFSYKIIFLDKPEQDYLVVHELCHLLQMNHSREFWKLVSSGIPDYRESRSKLKKFHLHTVL
jgi:predicted metal-dependent hydrolase